MACLEKHVKNKELHINLFICLVCHFPIIVLNLKAVSGLLGVVHRMKCLTKCPQIYAASIVFIWVNKRLCFLNCLCLLCQPVIIFAKRLELLYMDFITTEWLCVGLFCFICGGRGWPFNVICHYTWDSKVYDSECKGSHSYLV